MSSGIGLHPWEQNNLAQGILTVLFWSVLTPKTEALFLAIQLRTPRLVVFQTQSVDPQNRKPTNHACYWRPVFDAELAPNTTDMPRFVLCELAHPQKLTGKDISIQRVHPHR